MSRKGTTNRTGKTLFNFRLIIPGIGLFFMCLATVGCADEHKSTIGNVDPEEFPTMLTTDVSTLVSDSGYTRYHLTTDLWLVFDEAKEPKWRFPTGLYMERYDDSMAVTSTFRSDSALYLTTKRLWRFDGNVRMKNTDGDRFATEQLFWDQAEQKVYSDSFIHIERVDRILEGYGFVSNEQMTEYTILNVSGIFPTPQRKERADSVNMETGSTQPDSVDQAPAKRALRNSRNEPTQPPTVNVANEPGNIKTEPAKTAPSKPSPAPAKPSKVKAEEKAPMKAK